MWVCKHNSHSTVLHSQATMALAWFLCVYVFRYLLNFSISKYVYQISNTFIKFTSSIYTFTVRHTQRATTVKYPFACWALYRENPSVKNFPKNIYTFTLNEFYALSVVRLKVCFFCLLHFPSLYRASVRVHGNKHYYAHLFYRDGAKFFRSFATAIAIAIAIFIVIICTTHVRTNEMIQK